MLVLPAPPAPEQPHVDDPTVRELCKDYFSIGVRDITQHCVKEKLRIIDHFLESFANRRVSTLKAIDLQRYIASNPQWVSGWTRKGRVAAVKSIFNWALNNDLIVKNPFRAVKEAPGERRRHMTDEEFRGIMRHSHPYFRRFVFMCVKTGMRPGEVSHLKWSDIDWERGAIVLKKHKTMRKTRKPRIIPLSRMLRKFLEYLWRRSPLGITQTLKALLADGPVLAPVVIAAVQPLKIRSVQVQLALRAIGVEITRRRISSQRCELGHQHWNYALATSPVSTVPVPPIYQYVFLHKKTNLWTNSCVAFYISQLRKKGVIGEDCQLYMARHKFATDCIKNKVPIQMVAELLGHADTTMTQTYLHVCGDVSTLREAMEQGQIIRTRPNGSGGCNGNGRDRRLQPAGSNSAREFF